MPSLTFEKYYPFLGGAGSGALSSLFDLEIPSNAPLLLSATVTFGAVAAGFVGTSLSILTSLERPVMQEIRATSYLRILQNYIAWALVSGILLALSGLAGLALDLCGREWFICLLCGSLIFCLCCLWRLGNLMLVIFVTPPNEP